MQKIVYIFLFLFAVICILAVSNEVTENSLVDKENDSEADQFVSDDKSSNSNESDTDSKPNEEEEENIEEKYTEDTVDETSGNSEQISENLKAPVKPISSEVSKNQEIDEKSTERIIDERSEKPTTLLGTELEEMPENQENEENNIDETTENMDTPSVLKSSEGPENQENNPNLIGEITGNLESKSVTSEMLGNHENGENKLNETSQNFIDSMKANTAEEFENEENIKNGIDETTVNTEKVNKQIFDTQKPAESGRAEIEEHENHIFENKAVLFRENLEIDDAEKTNDETSEKPRNLKWNLKMVELSMHEADENITEEPLKSDDEIIVKSAENINEASEIPDNTDQKIDETGEKQEMNENSFAKFIDEASEPHEDPTDIKDNEKSADKIIDSIPENQNKSVQKTISHEKSEEKTEEQKSEPDEDIKLPKIQENNGKSAENSTDQTSENQKSKSDENVIDETSVLSTETETEQVLVIALINRFAQMHERVFSPYKDVVELQSLAPVDAMLQIIGKIAMEELLIQHKFGLFECRQDVQELLHDTDLVKKIFTDLLWQDSAQDGQDKFTMGKLLINDGVASLQLLFSFAARVTATIGQKNVAETAGEHSGNYKNIEQNVTEIFDQNVAKLDVENSAEIDSNNAAPKLAFAQLLAAFLAAYKCIKNVDPKEEKIYDYRIEPKWDESDQKNKSMMLRFGWKPGTAAERQISRDNFVFLQHLSQRTLTPAEVVQVAHKADSSVGMGGAMVGQESPATELFSAVAQHYATLAGNSNESSPSMAQQAWSRSDMLCVIATFGRNMLRRISANPEKLGIYLDQAGIADPKSVRAKIGVNSEVVFLSKSLDDFQKKYCATVESNGRMKDMFNWKENYLHYELAVHIDWNPWKELIHILDDVRSKLISEGVFQNTFNHNAKSSAEFEKIVQKLDQHSGDLSQKVSLWKNNVHLAEKAGAEVLGELEKIRAKFEENSEQFERQQIVMEMKK